MKAHLFFLPFIVALTVYCSRREPDNTIPEKVFYTPDTFVMGADLSYLNEILDHGGVFFDSGTIQDPYRIFADYGANVARFRLFHHPVWTREKYGLQGTQMYQDLNDVIRGMSRAKAQGMQLCLDFHYSDTWADPAHQIIPDAWKDLDIMTLKDSVYQYTFHVLKKLDSLGLMPEFVQTGNEINPGFLLPAGDRWKNTQNFILLMNAAISAVRDAGALSAKIPKIILHIAQPENALNWFQGLNEKGMKDFDIIGVSYYYIWSDVPLANISNYVSVLKRDYGKEVMVMETAYPWTLDNADNYPNIIDTTKILADYPPSPEGQYKYLTTLTQEIIDGGGAGIFYWEPGWVSSSMKTQWGTGSAWDCNALFDFQGEVLPAIGFMTYPYRF